MHVKQLLLWVYVLGAAVAFASSHPNDAVEVEVSAQGDAAIRGDASHIAADGKPSMDARNRVKTTSSPHSEPQRSDADVQSQASLVVFQKELEVLETMVALQVRKLQILEKMRTSLVGDPGSTVDSSGGDTEEESARRRHRTQQATRRELQKAVDRQLDAVAARVLAENAETQFDSFFFEKALVDLQGDEEDGEILDVKMGKIQNLPTLDLIAVGSRSGKVRLLLSSGREVLRMDTQLTPLLSVQLETASDPPLLAVLAGGVTTQLRVFALNVQLDDKHTQGNSDGNSARRLVEIHSVTSREIPMTSIEGSISAIAIARSARRSLLSVTHTDGRLGFYALNGTLVHEVSTHASHIHTLVTHRNLVAFANATSVAVFPMARQKVPEYQICHGSRADVASIAFDPVFTDVLYVGTTDGELLTFLLAGQNADPSQRCTLSHRVVVARTKLLKLATFKGFVAVATGTELVIFNVTRTDGAVKIVRTCSMRTESNGRVATAENGHATVLSVVTTDGAGVPALLILQSLLPKSDAFSSETNLWRGATILAMLIIVVIATKFFLRRQNENDTSRFDSMAESGKWRELLDKHTREASVGATTAAPATATASMPSRHYTTASSNDEYVGDPTMYNATPDMFSSPHARHKRGYGDRDVDEDELRRKIAEARRETFECSFDDTEDDE